MSQYLLCKADAARIPLPDRSVDLVVGSGTTVEAAMKHGRRAIGSDIRQCRGALETARQRIERPHAPVRRDRPEPEMPLFDVA